MDYEKLYNEALERAKYCLTTDMDNSGHWAVKHIFPELKESEDERIRKWLIKYFNKGNFNGILEYANNIKSEEIISWLEKQGEQKPADKTELKFKEGDWVKHNDSKEVFLVKEIGNAYYMEDTAGITENNPTDIVDELSTLWTIQDAKDGDVIANGNMILIFKEFEMPAYNQHIIAYIGLDREGHIQVTDNYWTLGIDRAKPATKEQRDLLFQKMEEAGYEWDAEKKELNKIEQ